MAIKALFPATKQTSNNYYKFKGRNESSSRIAERHTIFILFFAIPEYSQYRIEDVPKINLLKKGYSFVDLNYVVTIIYQFSLVNSLVSNPYRPIQSTPPMTWLIIDSYNYRLKITGSETFTVTSSDKDITTHMSLNEISLSNHKHQLIVVYTYGISYLA